MYCTVTVQYTVRVLGNTRTVLLDRMMAVLCDGNMHGSGAFVGEWVTCGVLGGCVWWPWDSEYSTGHLRVI